MNLRNLPTLLAATVLLASGAWRIAASHEAPYTGVALLAAGLVTLGIWLNRDG